MTSHDHDPLLAGVNALAAEMAEAEQLVGVTRDQIADMAYGLEPVMVDAPDTRMFTGTTPFANLVPVAPSISFGSSAGSYVARIANNGEITLADGVELSEASRVIWDGIQSIARQSIAARAAIAAQCLDEQELIKLFYRESGGAEKMALYAAGGLRASIVNYARAAIEAAIIKSGA